MSLTKPQQLKVAMRLAEEYHKGQKYTGFGDYYKCHIMPVFDYLRARDPEDLDGMIVAVLHDIIEDTEATETFLLEEGISETCVAAVGLLTRSEGEEEDFYLKFIAKCELTKRVKIADAMINLEASYCKGEEHRIEKYSRIIYKLASGGIK